MSTFVTCKTSNISTSDRQVRGGVLGAIALGIVPALLVATGSESAQAQVVSEPASVVAPTRRPFPDYLPRPSSLTILNPSFEEDILGEGSASDYITGWQVFGDSSSSAGVFSPGASDYGGVIPSGLNVAYAHAGGNIFQRLTESLTANTVYKLGIYVGLRPHSSFGSYSVELMAGDNVLAVATEPNPELGSFLYVETTPYTVTETNPFLGQSLGIRLSSSGAQIDFDNVNLLALNLSPDRTLSLGTEDSVNGTVAPVTEVISSDEIPAEISGDESIPIVETGSSFRLLAATAAYAESDLTIAPDEANSTSVPEPTSILGLLTAGALSLRLLGKQRHQRFNRPMNRG